MRRATQLLSAFLLMLGTACAHAVVAVPTVNVTLLPASQNASVGDNLVLQVFGEYIGSARLLSGAFNLEFDPAAVSITSVAIAAGLGDIASSNGSIDNLGGSVLEVGFASFSGVTGSFLLATVNLNVLHSGTTQLNLSDANSPVFTWTNSDVSVDPFGEAVLPVFSNASIEVSAVPLPLPIALLGGALCGLFGIGRRRIA